jgi:FkbM family methyltransferase
MNLERMPQFVKNMMPAPLKRAIRAAVRPPDLSQGGEVTLIWQLVRGYECQNYVVDVGANDGVTISNSFPFIDAGWKGILIEPAPAVFQKLMKNLGKRKTVTCLQMACSNKTGEADLYLGADGEEGLLSSLCQSDNEWFRQARGSQTVRVKTDTLTNVFAEYNSPGCPGLLLVDCEGMDYEVFLGLDFSRYRPTVIVTEEYEWEPQKHAAKYSLLIHNNYSLVQKVGCNTIWLDRSARRRAGVNHGPG